MERSSCFGAHSHSSVVTGVSVRPNVVQVSVLAVSIGRGVGGYASIASRSVGRGRASYLGHHSPAGKLNRAGSPRRSQVLPRTPLSMHASCRKVQSRGMLDPLCSAAYLGRTRATRAPNAG